MTGLQVLAHGRTRASCTTFNVSLTILFAYPEDICVIVERDGFALTHHVRKGGHGLCAREVHQHVTCIVVVHLDDRDADIPTL